MTRNHIGVDLSKDALDVFDPRRGETRIVNQPKAIARWAARLGPDDFVVFEATSGCDRAVRAGLEAAGRDFVRLNPLHAWHFARSLNLREDRPGRRAHARPPRRRAPARLRTRTATPPGRSCARSASAATSSSACSARRRTASATPGTAAGRCATSAPSSPTSPAASRAFDKAIAAHIARHPALAEDAGLLRSIPGIGPVAATEILAHLPEAGRVDRREVASLAGLAPRARESGKYKGKRRLGDGRRHLRRALYMAALSALRHPGFLSGLRRAHEGRQEAGEGHPHGGGAAAARHRQRHSSEPDPLPATGIECGMRPPRSPQLPRAAASRPPAVGPLPSSRADAGFGTATPEVGATASCRR